MPGFEPAGSCCCCCGVAAWRSLSHVFLTGAQVLSWLASAVAMGVPLGALVTGVPHWCTGTEPAASSCCCSGDSVWRSLSHMSLTGAQVLGRPAAAAAVGVPLGALITPLPPADVASIPVVQRQPVTCSVCGSFLNMYSYVRPPCHTSRLLSFN